MKYKIGDTILFNYNSINGIGLINNIFNLSTFTVIEITVENDSYFPSTFMISEKHIVGRVIR